MNPRFTILTRLRSRSLRRATANGAMVDDVDEEDEDEDEEEDEDAIELADDVDDDEHE